MYCTHPFLLADNQQAEGGGRRGRLEHQGLHSVSDGWGCLAPIGVGKLLGLGAFGNRPLLPGDGVLSWL